MEKSLTQHSQDRLWIILSHASAFLGFVVPFFGNVLGPLVIWVTKKGIDPEVEYHAKQALNFQLSVSIYLLVSGILIFLLIGIPMVLALYIFSAVYTVLNMVRAANGEEVNYPMSIRFID